MTEPADKEPVKKKKLKKQLGRHVCTLCPRHLLTKNVGIPGYGPPAPRLVVVAESPSVTEDVWCRVHHRVAVESCYNEHKDQVGQPLVGPAGKILQQALVKVGIPPNEVYYTNCARCSGGNPSMLHVRVCVSAYLLDELSKLDYSNCRGVMLLGETALRGVLNDGRLKIREARMKDLTSYSPIRPDGSPVIPVQIRATWHPAAALSFRDPRKLDDIIDDLKAFDRQRDPIKPVRRISGDQIPESIEPGIVGLDLEWDTQGRIRLAGLSDGEVNAVTSDLPQVLDWIETE